MEPEHWSGNSKPSTMHSESSHDTGDPIVKGKMSRSSSSSSDSSFDPLTDSDDGRKNVLDNSITKSEQDDSNSSPEGLAQTLDWSMVSASPRAEPGPSPEHSLQTPEWRTLSASPKQSPPTQMMGRAASGYDPNRIPSSVFTSKPSTPMEWSVASNESLFSIHMGNNSFSRDHAIMLYKSGELTSQRPVTEAKSNELNNSPPSLPVVIEVASDNHKIANMGEESLVKESADETPKETAKDHSKESMPPAEGSHISTSASNVSDGKEMPPADGVHTSASTPRLSDESGNSSSSFAFPVLTGEGGKTASVKVAPENLQPSSAEKPEPEPQAPVATPKPAETKWFSCFPCCSLGC